MKNLPLLVFILLFSCGKKTNSKAHDGPGYEELEPEGIYSAHLQPLNHVKVKGAVTITKYGDNLTVRVSLKNAPEGIHVQGLHAGESCAWKDTNNDQLIDLKEAESSVGKLLVPFDGDLRSWEEGYDFFPFGNYDYERSTSYSLMLADLNQKRRQGHLKLQGRVVMIRGRGDQADLPIACGILALSSDYDEPEEPRRSPVRIKPPPRVEPVPEPIPPPEAPRSRWQRFRDRLERWWNRWFGGRESNVYLSSKRI